jgi:hypothetical protein
MDSEALESDMYYYPSTPPLSAPGSAISSPSSSDMLQTPMNTMFFGIEGFEGVKEGCQGDVQSENLAGEWARCGSPPMTPGKFLLVQLFRCRLFSMELRDTDTVIF